MEDQYYAVLLFDSRENVRTFISHNLSKEEAEEEVGKLRSDGLPAFHISYNRRHRSPEAESCKACEKL